MNYKIISYLTRCEPVNIQLFTGLQANTGFNHPMAPFVLLLSLVGALVAHIPEWLIAFGSADYFSSLETGLPAKSKAGNILNTILSSRKTIVPFVLYGYAFFILLPWCFVYLLVSDEFVEIFLILVYVTIPVYSLLTGELLGFFLKRRMILNKVNNLDS